MVNKLSSRCLRFSLICCLCVALLFGGITLFGRATSSAQVGRPVLTGEAASTPSQLPSPWNSKDVGSVGLPGSASFANGAFTLRGAGADVYSNADEFHYAYQQLNGDGEIIARVTSLQNTHPSAKAGIMIRENLTTGSRHALLNVKPDGGVEFMKRRSPGASTTLVMTGSWTAPYWLRLSRNGNNFTAYTSVNGTSWTLLITTNLVMRTDAYVGLIVSSHQDTLLCQAKIDKVRINLGSTPIPTPTPSPGQLPSPWNSKDVGSVGLPGSASFANGAFTLRGAGADVYSNADEFHYAYQQLNGDGEIIARVTSLQNTHPSAKAGIMIRENLTTGSRHALLNVKPDGGVEFMKRRSPGASTTLVMTGSWTAPYWLRLSRNGNNFTAYTSVNGTSWTLLITTNLVMRTDAYVGLIVSSHNDPVLSTATIDNVKVNLGATPIPPPPPPPGPTAGTLTPDEVQTIIAQAVSAASQLGRAVTVAVVDREGNVLGVFKMNGASSTTQIRGGAPFGRGLEGLSVPSTLAAISKAGTAAFFSTMGNAFNTRTAGFIIQEHFPPGINFQPGGPLFGVQYSSLPCSDIKKPGLPLGLSADPGSMPVYKNGVAMGGVGIEGDGVYGIDKDPSDFDQPFEEVIAVSAVRGFATPALIRGDNILIDGIRLPFINVTNAPSPSTIPFSNLPGVVDAAFPIRGAQVSAFRPTTVGGIDGEADRRFFPFKASPNGLLTADDVGRIIAQAAQQANITRAAIRQPLGSSARVSIAVVDTEGRVLGIFRNADAPVFGFDVSVQKARAAAFFSKASAATQLRNAGFGFYVDRAAADGLHFDGSVAFSDRAIGFLHRPFFPDGIDNTAPGPFSNAIGDWSVFNVGLQLDLIQTNLLATLGGASVPCTSVPGLPNGIQIFAGSIPLYKNGTLAGAIGISGDGIDQDDIIAAAGSNGFVPPAAIRADQVFVRGVRLPFVKFPRSPNL